MVSSGQPNIVQYIDHHEHDRWIYIIMEYVPMGELSTYLSTQGKIKEDMVQTIARQILRALHYLHKRRITHRDIKPDNILIASLDPLRVKLSDFGLSKVTQEETFLKTFCGTLLYCAPEVYPDYETYRRGDARKRRRVGDPLVPPNSPSSESLLIVRPPKTSPYSQAVDMWSLGAVLYHILSGVPPYTGRAEDRGQQMLRCIMESEADYDILRREGISESGIDFVSQLLNRDPFARPGEKDCFQHPWIAQVPDVDEYEDDDILTEIREGLSVIGEDDELDASQLSLSDDRAYAYGADGDESGSSEALAKRPRLEEMPTDIKYPSLPNIESFQDGQVVAEHQARRLFGEVTSSALRSSYALGQTGSWAGHDFEAEDFESSGESMSDEHSVYSIISLPETPFGGTAPSLMGAENLVGRLNMNSSHPLLHPQTGPITESSTRQTTPGEPRVPMNPGSTPREGRDPTSSDNPDITPKPPKISRRIDLDIPETASERSSDGSAPVSRRGSMKPSGPPTGVSYDIELAETLDAQTGQAILDAQLKEQLLATEESSDPIVHKPDTPISIPENEFAKPAKPLGRLKSLSGSIFDLNIRLESRLTSWGRGLEATIRHEDKMDVRIPAYALEITFWAPKIECMIAEGKDWKQVPGVMAVLSTKTRKCIWVNGVELRKSGPEGLQFGKLYTGDVITVYKKNGQYLDLRCEFYHGESIQTRPAHEAGFVVRQALVRKSDGATNRMPVSVRPVENLKKDGEE